MVAPGALRNEHGGAGLACAPRQLATRPGARSRTLQLNKHRRLGGDDSFRTSRPQGLENGYPEIVKPLAVLFTIGTGI
jgi:hypothetical protein